MADFLSLIGTVLNSRQRAADSARASREFGQDLAFRGNESRLARDARANEIANQIALDRERMSQEEELRRAALAQEQSQFGSRLGLDYSRLGQEGSQFGMNLAQRQTEAERDYEAQLAQQQLAREAGMRQEQQLLASLADRFDSPDILNLLGGQLGVPGLGSRTYLPSSMRRNASGGRGVRAPGIGGYFGTTPPVTTRYSYDGGKTWDRPA